MKDPFESQFDEMCRIYAERFPDDETELAPDDFLHWYGAQLSEADREFIVRFILDWDLLAFCHRIFFTCADCRQTNAPVNFSEIGNKRYCKKCRQAAAVEMPDTNPPSSGQPSLFAAA